MSITLRTILILSVFITLSFCSSSNFRRQLQETTTNNNINNNELNEDSSRGLHSDEIQFQLLTFNSLLSHYTFNAKWTSEDSEDDSYTVLSECSFDTSKETKPSLPTCNLVSYSNVKDTEKMTQLVLNLDQSKEHTVDTNNAVLKVNGVSSHLVKNENDQVISEKNCQIDVSYSFFNTPTQKPFIYATDKVEDLSIQIKVSGGDCDADNATPLLHIENKKYDPVKVYGYIACMILLGLIQAIACGILIIKIDRNNLYARQAALGTLCMMITFDFSIFLQHSDWANISDLMVGVVVLFFLISVFFEPALLYFVFSTLQRRHNVSIRSLMFKLYFWLIFSVIGIVATQTYQSEYIFYTYPLCLLPQIIDSMLHRQKYRWNYVLLLGLGLPKLIYLAILAFNPFDLFTNKLNPSVVVLSLTILAFELTILKVQTRWPGLGIVKKNTQNLFSYECQNDEIETVAAVVCSICTEKVGSTPCIGQQPIQDQESAKSQPIMKTPCLHYYHESCLKEWFKKKFECPNCRQNLPPLENEDDDE